LYYQFHPVLDNDAIHNNGEIQKSYGDINQTLNEIDEILIQNRHLTLLESFSLYYKHNDSDMELISDIFTNDL
jgi:hypothetical protein